MSFHFETFWSFQEEVGCWRFGSCGLDFRFTCSLDFCLFACSSCVSVAQQMMAPGATQRSVTITWIAGQVDHAAQMINVRNCRCLRNRIVKFNHPSHSCTDTHSHMHLLFWHLSNSGFLTSSLACSDGFGKFPGYKFDFLEILSSGGLSEKRNGFGYFFWFDSAEI